MWLELGLAIANAVRSKEEDDEDDSRLKSREIASEENMAFFLGSRSLEIISALYSLTAS